jgi:hypothetical protein
MRHPDPPVTVEMGGPVAATPPRGCPSVRRTSHIDIVHSGGPGGELHLAGGARDLHTSRDGHATVVGTASLGARVGADRRLLEVWTAPDEPGTSALLGRVVGSGFRGAVARCVPDHAEDGTPLHLLLDDLPIAALLSGYSRRAAMVREGCRYPAVAHPHPDICAGWRSGGAMLSLLAAGRLPVVVGPPAPPLDAGDDTLAWHAGEPLPIGAMRRRRRLDVGGRDPLRIDAMFRDTYVDGLGVEHVLHEYSLTADVDSRTLIVQRVDVSPRVLPHADCVPAALTAGGICGLRIPLLRNYVEQALFGPSTCTHLNDLLRSLADAGRLAAAGRLAPGAGMP